ncbi:hypothetical protein [Streptomyces anulatus]
MTIEPGSCSADALVAAHEAGLILTRDGGADHGRQLARFAERASC